MKTPGLLYVAIRFYSLGLISFLGVPGYRSIVSNGID
jgi:hypothetical protein